jgi:hypothetical protein
MQDTLLLINLASGSLLTVLVLYLVLHQGAGMRTQQLYPSRRCENKGQDSRSWENYGTRGCANSYVERLCKLCYSQSRVMPGLQQQTEFNNTSKRLFTTTKSASSQGCRYGSTYKNQ